MKDYIKKVVRNEPAYEQVESYIRGLIESGEWPAGVKLPINSVIAERTGTSTFTVQTAMERLCREGLLERKPKVGTYVKGHSARLTCVGVYFGCDLWTSSEFGFHQALYRELRKQWNDMGVRTAVWTDDRMESQQDELLPALRRAIDRREIQAVVAPLINSVDIEGLKKLKVPLVLNSVRKCNNRVGFNWKQMMRLGLERLRDQGCKTVGLITPVYVEPEKRASGEENDKIEFYEAFLDEIRHLGLETCNAWIRSPESYPERQEQYGYQQFEALWNQKNHPEGLMVYPDLTVRGVLMSILARRVSVPRDLKLVIHLNDQCPYECPFPVTQLVTKVELVAAEIIKMTHAQIKGDSVQQILMPFEAVEKGTSI